MRSKITADKTIKYRAEVNRLCHEVGLPVLGGLCDSILDLASLGAPVIFFQLFQRSLPYFTCHCIILVHTVTTHASVFHSVPNLLKFIGDCSFLFVDAFNPKELSNRPRDAYEFIPKSLLLKVKCARFLTRR